jgi:hypothetical protein
MEDKTKAEKDKDLSKALEQTFPASDPVAGNEVDDHPVRPAERKAPVIDKALVDELARKVKRDHGKG